MTALRNTGFRHEIARATLARVLKQTGLFHKVRLMPR